MLAPQLNGGNSRFPKGVRLLKPRQFAWTNKKSRHIKHDDIRVRVRYETTLASCQLGIAITKRTVKNATDRNRIKRLIRETFRHRHHQLPRCAVIVSAASPQILKRQNAEICQQLNKVFDKITSSIQPPSDGQYK